MNWDIGSILDQSISQIAAGKARRESCLLAYPTLADELDPLLLTASTLQTIPVSSLSPAARARIEAQILAAAAANPLLRPPARRWAPVALPTWRFALNALAAGVVVVMLLMATLVPASADALPGSVLYPVKLASEDVWLWVTPVRSEPALHLRFARRRLVEIEELASQGQVDRAVLESLNAEVEAALDGLESLPPAIALPLLEETARFVEEQQSSLSAMVDIVPTAMRSVMTTTLSRSRAQAARIRTLHRRLRSLEPDASAATLEPVAPLAVTSTLTATQTLAPTLTPTLSPTIEPTATLAPTETLEPAATATPPPAPTGGGSSGAATKPPPAPTEPPPQSTEPPPAPTDPPPEPPPTEDVPPGLTKTPQPPGLTKTPKPTNKSKP